MGLFSAAKLFGITIRESADDGSDFTNPDADYRRLFLGEDGALHLKDSAGTVTDIGGGGSGVASGTANPGGPSAGDLFYRTDLKLLITYDGTRWVTVQQYLAPMSDQNIVDPVSANNSKYGVLPGAAVWVDDIICTTQVNVTNDGAKYWTCSFTANPTTGALGSFTTGTGPDTAGAPAKHLVTVGAALAATDLFVGVTWTKTSTPGTIFCWAAVRYRLIAT